MKVRETDEDACLTLNVWAPATDEPLPVLVWFHGGSFVIGSSSQPVYDGAFLASEQQVVVVSANYRLGALGFLDARSFGGVANCGVRDAICALEWVRDNIGAFGGDPTRVVAFGESGGGGLLLHALAAPAADGLLAGAIMQSGATFATLDTKRGRDRARDAGQGSGRRRCGRAPRPADRRADRRAGNGDVELARNGRDDAVPPDGRRRPPPGAAGRRVRQRRGRGRRARRRDHRRRDAAVRPARRRAGAARTARAARGALPRHRRAGRGADRRPLRARARHRRHERDLARRSRRQRDAGAVPRGARGPRSARPDVHLLLHVGRPEGRRVPRHRHPVPVRQLRRRLGRVRRSRRRRARPVAGDAARVGRVRARRAIPVGRSTPRRASSVATCTTRPRTRSSRAYRF